MKSFFQIWKAELYKKKFHKINLIYAERYFCKTENWIAQKSKLNYRIRKFHKIENLNYIKRKFRKIKIWFMQRCIFEKLKIEFTQKWKLNYTIRKFHKIENLKCTKRKFHKIVMQNYTFILFLFLFTLRIPCSATCVKPCIIWKFLLAVCVIFQ